MAVPFNGNNSPSLNSEFSQPDVNICLSYLSYYEIGLTKNQIIEAFRILLSLGEGQQRSFYEKWFESIKDNISTEDLNVINIIDKIDLSNNDQMQLIYESFRYCSLTIDFWLANCVFPNDTIQYESRMMSTAWDIANSNSIGFSGTKDAHKLFPTTIAYKESSSPSIVETDGMMVSYLLNLADCHCIEDENQSWESVIDCSLSSGNSALVDTGALITGVTNEKVAEYIIKQSKEDFRGAVYFNAEQDVWFICDRKLNHMALSSSSIPEKDAFVYFDEKRSRGADMKLKTDAVAMLTLGPGLQKDKLMQGAGRLRQLGRGQKLFVVCFNEVKNSIEMFAPFSMTSILKWTVDNSVQAISKGLVQWSKNGQHHDKVIADHKNAIVPELTSVESLYAPALINESCIDFLEKSFSHMQVSSSAINQKIKERVKEYGSDIFTSAVAISEECERELSKEVEIFEEKEIVYAKVNCSWESSWDWDSIIDAVCVTEIDKNAGIIHIQDQITKYLPKKFWKIDLKSVGLWATKNFFTTTICDIKCSTEYQRPVGSILYIEGSNDSKEVAILISEYETNEILKVFLDRSPANVKLISFSFVRSAKNPKENSLMVYPLGESSVKMSETLIAAIQLFNGDTQFSTKERKKPLSKLISTDSAKKNAYVFCEMRGLLHNYYKSDLHYLVTE